MNLLSSASVFSFFTLISRILGYLRDILIAIFLGASIFADAFFVAFRLPNTFRRLFAEGTFNAAFIPSYTSIKTEDKKKGKKFADDVLGSLLLILLFIVTIVEIFTPYLIYIIAPGFLEDQIKFDLAVELLKINNNQKGFDELLKIFDQNPKWNDEAAKKKLLEYFDLLGFNDPNVVNARKKLSSLMFK